MGVEVSARHRPSPAVLNRRRRLTLGPATQSLPYDNRWRAGAKSSTPPRQSLGIFRGTQPTNHPPHLRRSGPTALTTQQESLHQEDAQPPRVGELAGVEPDRHDTHEDRHDDVHENRHAAIQRRTPVGSGTYAEARLRPRISNGEAYYAGSSGQLPNKAGSSALFFLGRITGNVGGVNDTDGNFSLRFTLFYRFTFGIIRESYIFGRFIFELREFSVPQQSVRVY